MKLVKEHGIPLHCITECFGILDLATRFFEQKLHGRSLGNGSGEIMEMDDTIVADGAIKVDKV